MQDLIEAVEDEGSTALTSERRAGLAQLRFQYQNLTRLKYVTQSQFKKWLVGFTEGLDNLPFSENPEIDVLELAAATLFRVDKSYQISQGLTVEKYKQYASEMRAKLLPEHLATLPQQI